MYFSNQKEFYPVSFMPIGEHDQLLIQTNLTSVHDASHWLVALDGHPMSKQSDFYIWNVLVYTANDEGTFTVNKPHYRSENFTSFEQASEFAKFLTASGRKDEMMKATYTEKIS